VPVIWSLHHADLDPRHTRPGLRVVNLVCARLSGWMPARVVCCAETGRRAHEAIGYRADRLLVIPNGVDVGAVDRDPEAGGAVRRALGIAVSAPVVGLVARLHPDKDHRTFLAAASAVTARRPDVVFLLAGAGVDAGSAALSGWLAGLRPRPTVRLLGVRRDVPALLSACDVVASSSRAEAFPLILGEAMACRVPCVATDVGDARAIVGEAGVLVSPGDPGALARGILQLLGLSPGERRAVGDAARARALERCDLRATARRYVGLYAEVAANGARPRPPGGPSRRRGSRRT
jgi:glycosyltransferase involved in cell wall biosynthesis